ncbi:MAG: DNA topoisomerase IV subunit A, partial [Bacilli bacterium]
GKRKVAKAIKEYVEEKIIEEDLDIIVGERFGRYSKFIIQDRALPDARDGLKPVQRRILYAMYKLGLFSGRPYKKAARIVGDVIGKYHPHGDASVYDAMVRLSQDFKMRLPLVDMHGNNGSVDGDPPAAMRYTEARLSKYSEYLLRDINKKTVGFVPNFDDEEYEPTVLPAKFPNLLVNGATGISAGYATEIPPHNIDEIIRAVIYKLEHKNASLDKLMEIVQGPDFPTGGIVQGIDGIKKAYKTGRGRIVIKAKTEIVPGKNKNQLVVTEIPFDVNKAALVKRMNDICARENIDGVLDIRDETDREGLRIVVDIRKDVNPEDIRNFFIKKTDLQVSYNFNMVVIANKRPMLMGLDGLLDAYISHQKEVITNRSNYELNAARKRLHIVEGLIAMVSILDAVIQTIRSSQNKKDAIANLVSTYDFTFEQAEAIVNLQLYRLTNTDIVLLSEEAEKLREEIEKLKNILASEPELLKAIKNELKATLKELSTPRKTVIEHEIEEVKVEVSELVAKEEVYLIITRDGYIKRMTPKAYNSNEETKLKEGDLIVAEYKATTLDTLLMFTNLGNYVYLPIQKIPEVRHRDLGYNVSTLVTIDPNERVVHTMAVEDFEADIYLLFTTKNGLIKRVPLKNYVAFRYSKSLLATKLRAGDELVSVDCGPSDSDVVVITKEG